MVDIDVSELKQYIEGTIDFEGQTKATNLINRSLVLGASASVVATLLTDRFEVLVGGLALSYVISLGICLPWGAYRKNPVNWASAGEISLK